MYNIMQKVEGHEAIILQTVRREEKAEALCKRYAREDEYERTIGYYVPNVKYWYEKVGAKR